MRSQVRARRALAGRWTQPAYPRAPHYPVGADGARGEVRPSPPIGLGKKNFQDQDLDVSNGERIVTPSRTGDDGGDDSESAEDGAD